MAYLVTLVSNIGFLLRGMGKIAGSATPELRAAGLADSKHYQRMGVQKSIMQKGADHV
ncbi:hypothetical protein LU631_20500 [Erwinia tracheiphila]|uniref:hypothetical protein n=1 Tax=Erwinia tracheiphila TaxID=65700 RepID=UPI0003A10516|nr:hypothetical protein [Erwinia tracheiphila]UIA84454.1 hypothetical protein LU604_05610 [Erwinia tracheiphila]UIA87131.1 hypothetical protein LU631_20500 [Erwinia tracheiphila]UIA93035.1 hypothetical protein LU632_05530 [Erwinia tracheiphila]UIA95490.1 hypothetical protein LU633_18950 [Erwinia tracheiphila]